MNKKIFIAFAMGVISSFVGGTLGLMAASPYTQERTEAVFVYGTLTNPLTRAYACLCFVDTRPGRLEGYTKTLRNVIPSPSGFVRGDVIVVSKKELARLDQYEGAPLKYQRTRITIGKIPMWVYLKNTGNGTVENKP